VSGHASDTVASLYASGAVSVDEERLSFSDAFAAFLGERDQGTTLLDQPMAEAVSPGRTA
jgi:hypothetical protein